MKRYWNWLSISLRAIIFLFLPGLLIFNNFYEAIFKIEMNLHWEPLLVFLFPFLHWMIKRYEHKTTEVKVEGLNEFEREISQRRWEILLHERNKIIVRPKFDFPFNIILSDKVEIHYGNNKAEISGPGHYINEFVEEIQSEFSDETDRKIILKNKFRIVAYLFFILLPFLLESGAYWEMKVIYHNAFPDSNEVVTPMNGRVLGNSIENIHNLGYAVENDKNIFYIDDNENIVKTDKKFENKTNVIESDSLDIIEDLNIVGDWLYYTEEESLNRVKQDGTNQETIYELGYMGKVHITKDWIYFINFEDNDNLYKMNLNGGKLQRVLDKEVNDIALYDSDLLISYTESGKDRVDQMNLDSNETHQEFDIEASNIMKWKDDYYYIGENQYLYRMKAEEPSIPELLIKEEVTQYTITDQGIFYGLFEYDNPTADPSDRLYKANLEGKESEKLLSGDAISGYAKVGDSIIFQVSDYGTLKLKRYDLQTEKMEDLNPPL